MAERSGYLNKEAGTDSVAAAAGALGDPHSDRGLTTSAAGESFDVITAPTEEPVETEHIKAQIEETRSQMGETIDAIQEKLSFANVSEQVSEQVSNAIETAKDSIYEATVGKAVFFMKNLGEDISETKVVRAVQNNPFPVLLIGVGAGLLAYQSFGKSKRPIRGLGQFEPGTGTRSFDRENTSFTGRVKDGVSNAADSAVSSVGNATGSAYEAVSGTLAGAYTSAGDAASRAYNAAGEYGSMAQEKYEYYLEENPLAVGAVAAALGAAVGLAFPSTRYEGQLMGEARQNLVDKAQSAAGDLVEKAKQVASEAGQTIKEEVRAQAQ